VIFPCIVYRGALLTLRPQLSVYTFNHDPVDGMLGRQGRERTEFLQITYSKSPRYPSRI